MQSSCWLAGLLTILLSISVSAQEVVLAPPKQLQEGTGTSDADVELNYARGAIKLSDVCSRLKSRPARSSFGCDRPTTLKDAKKIWERNEETSAWEAISALDEEKFGKKETRALVDQIMEDALGSVKIDNGKLSIGKVSPPETTGRTIFACGTQPECLKRALTPEERVAVAQYLLSVPTVSSGVALGLKALSDFGMASIAVNQNKNAEIATVSVSSLIGQPLTWKTGKNTSPLVKATGKANEIKVTFDAKQGKIAKVPVEIELNSGLKHTVFLSFDVNAEISNAKVLVKEKSTVKSENAIGSYPSKLDKVINVDRNEVVDLSVTVTSNGAALCPEQATFGFLATDGSSREYLVPGTCSDKEVRATIPNGQKLADELKFISGTYEIVFIASDERMSNPTFWKLAKAQLALSSPPEKKHEPLFTHHLLYESDTTLKALPEIHHQFREPDRRAPFVLSLVFSSSQVGLVLALIVTLGILGFRPADVLKSGRVLIFASVLTFIEAVLFWYWIAPSGAPNMESLAYKYIPPLLIVLLMATRQAFSRSSSSSSSSKKTASM